MRRLVLAVLVTLGLLAASQTAADAKSSSLLTVTVSESPSELFPGYCSVSISWTVKDPSKVATYYYDAPVNSVPPFPPTLFEPKKGDTDPPFPQSPSGTLEGTLGPGDVAYLSVLVQYVNGTFSPWQEEIITTQPC